MRKLAQSIAFIGCLYFGFEYDNTLAFIGAVLLFLTVVN